MRFPVGVYKRYKDSPWLWITYYDEYGNQIKEAAHTQELELAVDFRKLRMAQVAERRLIPTRQYEQAIFGELLDFWWERHAKHRKSKFEYLLPRLERFKPIKARQITPEMIQDFLYELVEKLAPSSVNHYRTIFNSTFNFAKKWKKYDDNPCAPVPQLEERDPRDRFVEVKEILALVEKCLEQEDYELLGFIILASCTGMRKGEILPRQWSEVRVDDEYPFIYTAKTKGGRPKRLPLPKLAVVALKLMPSYKTSEYLFPAKPNVRFKGNFSKPYAWDLGKRFRRVCTEAGINKKGESDNLRIHDLRHFATTALFMEGVPDNIIAKMTGHASRAVERYKHLSPSFKQQSVELIAGQLGKRLSKRILKGTKKGTTPKKAKPADKRRVKPPVNTGLNGGADGTRTRDLRRDRPAF